MRDGTQMAAASAAGDMRRNLRNLTLTAACLGVMASFAPADTVHRYSFNTDNSAEDTGTNAVPGFTDGTIIQGAGSATVLGGQLTTTEVGAGNGAAGAANPSVSLPTDFLGGDIGAGSFTVQQFFTRSATALNNYSTAFSFSKDTNNYILGSAGRGDGTNQYGWAIKQAGVNGGNEVLMRGGVLAAGSTHVSANVFNSVTGQATLFMDGVAVAQSAVGQLTGLNFSTVAVKGGINGNGPFGDKAMGGSTNDFRLDNAALTATQVAKNYLAGANNTVTVDTNSDTATGDYNDAATWSLGTPTATQNVVVNNTKTLTSGTGLAGILSINNGGTLNINGGTIAPATNLDLVGGSTVNLNGGTLALRGITVDGDVTSTNAAAHTINLAGGTLQAAGNYFAPATNIQLNVNTASTVDSQAFSMTLPGTVTGTANISKIGTGTAVFTGNTAGYTGAINVAAGTFGLGYTTGTHTGASAFSNAVNLDPAGVGASAAAGFTIGQSVATDVTSTVTLGTPAAPTLYAITGGAGTNQNANFIGKVTGGNANSTLNLTGFFKFDAPTSDFVGNVQINSNTAIALAGPNSLGGTTRTLVSNSGGIEPQTNTALTGANKFINPISVLANQAIYFTSNNNIDVGSTITGTLSGAASVSDIQKSGYGTVSLQGAATNIRSVVFNGGTGAPGAANTTPARVFQFATNFTGTNPSTATARGGIVDDGAGGNFDTQYAELTGGVTVSNLVLASKGRQNTSLPLLAGTVLNSAAGNNTWAGGLQIVNGGGGHRVNVATGSTLNVGGVINNNVGGGNRGYELTGGGTGVINATALDNTYYVAAPAASQLALVMIGETNTAGTALTNNGSWSLNSTGNTLSGSIQVVGGRFNVNGSTTSASTAASNQVFGYGGTLGGTGSIAQPVYIYASGTNITNAAFTAGFSTTNPFVNYLSYAPQAAGFVTGGGTIDPGTAANTIGTLSLTKTLSVNGAVAEQIDGTGAGTADKLAVTGALTLGGASTLNLSSLTSPDDAVYVLASYGTLSGTFGTVTGLPAGYTLSYNYLGNQIALLGTAAPTALYFTGASTNSLNTAANYSTDLAGANASAAAPGGGTDVYLASTNATAGNLNATVGSNLSVNSLTFGTGAAATNAVSIGGAGTITINAGAVAYAAGTGIVKQAGSAAATISANVALGSSQSWTNSSATPLTVSGNVGLGANTLTLAGTGNHAVSGIVSGTGGLTKSGTGIASLSGANTYSGVTTVQAGTLSAKTPAYTNVLNNTGGVNLTGGKFVLDYTGGSSPVANVKSILTAGYAGGFATGQIRSTTAAGAGKTLGYSDDGAGAVTVMYTLAGDANLNGTVDFNDFLVLQNNFSAAGTRFDQGNFNYDGVTDFNDFLVLQNNFGQSITGQPVLVTRAQVAAMTAFANSDASLVPEPASLAVLGLGGLLMGRRRRGR